MANDLSGRQWFFDTASGSAVWNHNIKVKQIEFLDYIADTDTCVITDKNGKLVWKGNGAADLSTVRSGTIGWVNGLIVSKIDNATGNGVNAPGSKVLVYVD